MGQLKAFATIALQRDGEGEAGARDGETRVSASHKPITASVQLGTRTFAPQIGACYPPPGQDDGNDLAFLRAVMFWALKRRRLLICLALKRHAMDVGRLL